jgi:hypothetical protein
LKQGRNSTGQEIFAGAVCDSLKMKRRRKIQGVLCNFLGTYTSRYSDYEGYWLFGFLANDIQQLKIDLLNPQTNNFENGPLAFAAELAMRKFSEQMSKNGIAVLWLREAHLDITKLLQSKNGFVNGRSCVGNDFRFTVQALSDLGKTYKTEVVVFVAPHNSSIESRSTRAVIF